MYDIWRKVWTDSDIVNEMHDEYIKQMIDYCDTEYKAVLALKVTYFLLDKKYIEEYDVRDTYQLIMNYETK